MGGPFEGIRVLDLTQVIAGPFGCMMLADMGAEVIKVEPPGGESWRLIAQFVPLESKTFQSLNRGKRSLVLKLDDPRAQEVVYRLIPSIDVVVTNYRPDVPARLKIDYATLSAIKPDLIYIDNTAFGRQGPLAQKPGYDIVAQAVTGLMVTAGKVDEGGAPRPASPAIADFSTGLTIAWAASTALFHRERTGEGQYLGTSLLATGMALMSRDIARSPVLDLETRDRMMARVQVVRDRGGGYAEVVQERGGVYELLGPQLRLYYGGYAVKDGAIILGTLTPRNRNAIRALLGIDDDPTEDLSFDVVDPANRPEIDRVRRRIADVMLTRTMDEWIEAFDAAGVPASRVNLPEELADDPQVNAAGLMLETDHEIVGPERHVGPLVQMTGTPTGSERPSPPLGRHTDEVLAEGGFSAEEIEALRAAGAAG